MHPASVAHPRRLVPLAVALIVWSVVAFVACGGESRPSRSAHPEWRWAGVSFVEGNIRELASSALLDLRQQSFTVYTEAGGGSSAAWKCRRRLDLGMSPARRRSHLTECHTGPWRIIQSWASGGIDDAGEVSVRLVWEGRGLYRLDSDAELSWQLLRLAANGRSSGVPVASVISQKVGYTVEWDQREFGRAMEQVAPMVVLMLTATP